MASLIPRSLFGPPGDGAAVPEPQISDSRDSAGQPSSIPLSGPPPNTRRCFVCLVDEPEADLPAEWSTPCKCTLEGHQECLLAWVADLESQGKEVKCPLCKSPIIMTERFDLAVRLGNFCDDMFAEWSPIILFVFSASSLLVTSSIYGIKAIDWFAGPEATMAFLLNADDDVTLSDLLRQPGQEEYRQRGPPINMTHFSLLPLIGPALVINRLYLGEVILIPASFAYATFLDETTEYASWPPSPQRTLAIYPAIRTTYVHLYYTLTTYLERRWQAQARQLFTTSTAAQEQGAVQAPYVPPPEENAGGFEFAFGLEDGNDDNHLRIGQIRIVDNIESPINLVAGALLYPSLCYGMGELLRLVLPTRFITRPASGPITSLLQERWGRSLVGGCLFVVLKDVFFLWEHTSLGKVADVTTLRTRYFGVAERATEAQTREWHSSRRGNSTDASAGGVIFA
ncbi:hypothetical protein AAE478_002219 [Parahypoxylon ruwenzoriense]